MGLYFQDFHQNTQSFSECRNFIVSLILSNFLYAILAALFSTSLLNTNHLRIVFCPCSLGDSNSPNQWWRMLPFPWSFIVFYSWDYRYTQDSLIGNKTRIFIFYFNDYSTQNKIQHIILSITDIDKDNIE